MTGEWYKMRKISEWADDDQPEQKRLVEDVPQRTDTGKPAKSLGEMVAHDALQIMSKLKRYRDDLKRDEARLMQALEQVRADLREAGEVMQAMQPAMEVVNRMSANGPVPDNVRETAAAVKHIINGSASR